MRTEFLQNKMRDLTSVNISNAVLYKNFQTERFAFQLQEILVEMRKVSMNFVFDKVIL